MHQLGLRSQLVGNVGGLSFALYFDFVQFWSLHYSIIHLQWSKPVFTLGLLFHLHINSYKISCPYWGGASSIYRVPLTAKLCLGSICAKNMFTCMYVFVYVLCAYVQVRCKCYVHIFRHGLHKVSRPGPLSYRF